MLTNGQVRGSGRAERNGESPPTHKRGPALAFLLLAALGCAQGDGRARPPGPETSGVVSGGEGSVEIEVRFVGAECAETPAATVPPCSGRYPGYEVTVLSARDGAVAARATTDGEGRCTLRLPAGDYEIRTPAGMPPAAPAATRFRVEAGATVRVPVTVDTGVR